MSLAAPLMALQTPAEAGSMPVRTRPPGLLEMGEAVRRALNSELYAGAKNADAARSWIRRLVREADSPDLVAQGDNGRVWIHPMIHPAISELPHKERSAARLKDLPAHERSRVAAKLQALRRPRQLSAVATAGQNGCAAAVRCRAGRVLQLSGEGASAHARPDSPHVGVLAESLSGGWGGRAGRRQAGALGSAASERGRGGAVLDAARTRMATAWPTAGAWWRIEREKPDGGGSSSRIRASNGIGERGMSGRWFYVATATKPSHAEQSRTSNWTRRAFPPDSVRWATITRAIYGWSAGRGTTFVRCSACGRTGDRAWPTAGR